jgi:hypothetical protein
MADEKILPGNQKPDELKIVMRKEWKSRQVIKYF